ncbi:hypothetical protein [Nocardiopsis synnemataformans]|uniref:hypothetical protein n=1 Tax=Nocardiopsis synnemataformans TaxID=61305 RepID=UPI003EB96475
MAHNPTTVEAACINACTTGCTNGTYARRVEYGPGRADYLTIQCACRGTECLSCQYGFPCEVNGTQYADPEADPWADLDEE